MNRMEAKANKLLDEATAGAELNKGPEDSMDNLVAKYGAKGGDKSVEDELASLKASIGR